jgi:hypothetical protein
VRVRVKGEFPRASSMQFIASDVVEATMARAPRWPDRRPGGGAGPESLRPGRADFPRSEAPREYPSRAPSNCLNCDIARAREGVGSSRFSETGRKVIGTIGGISCHQDDPHDPYADEGATASTATSRARGGRRLKQIQ